MSAITARDISDYVATQDDFDLELFVNRTLKERGVLSEHGGTYIDPYTNKPRQFDIRASIEFGKLGWGLNLAIECKSLSAEYPLIVSRVPRPAPESTYYLIKSWGRAEMGERFVAVLPSGNGLQLYPSGSPVGKQTFQLKKEPPPKNFKSGDSEAYDKWAQALASAADLVRMGGGAHIVYRKEAFFTLVLPVLVVSDDTLWVVDYDEEGQHVGPSHQVDACELYVDREYALADGKSYRISHLHIYTRKGLVAFLDSLTGPSSLQVERMFRCTVK